MRYALLSYHEYRAQYNVGDYTQSLAAKQFLPKVDEYINREKMSDHSGDETALIMNGWFTHNHSNWLPANSIIPLFVSFHVNSTAAPFMLNDEGVAYLKKHQPIGCRDEQTVDMLRAKGVDAYFSGCLTLTLDSYAVPDNEREGKVYIVDPFYNYPTTEKVFLTPKYFIRSILNGDAFNIGKANKHLRNLVDEELLKKAEFVTQIRPLGKDSIPEKFAYAEECLKKYAKAKLVITSRIHCALPCLALGTPVIFINSFDKNVDTCRFGGILDLFNRIDVMYDGSYTSNFGLSGKITEDIQIINSEAYIPLAESLKERCSDFINAF